MKKILFLTALISALTLGGCGMNGQNGNNATGGRDPQQEIPADVTDQVAGESQSADISAIQDTELLNSITGVNKNAVVTESLNSGEKMLSIEMPAPDDNVANEFVSAVTDIVNKCKLGQNDNYDYYYFCTTKEDKVLIFATFEEDDNTLDLENVKAVDSSLEGELEAAVSKSALFVKD